MFKFSIQNLAKSFQNLALSSNRTITTSNCVFSRLSVKSTKRRKTFPYHWLPRAQKGPSFPSEVTVDNTKFVEDFIQEKYTLPPGKSPLKYEPFPRGTYVPGSQRCGVIAKKIGVYPMWTKTGKRLLTSALQIVDNHVVSYIKNEEHVEKRRHFYKKHKFSHLDVIVVGAESDDPRNYPAPYLGLFNKAGIPPKKKLTRFFVTPNAAIAPGTPLDAKNFRVGDYVDIWGKTRDHGFQGVIRRWNFKGQLRFRGVTKAHRRPGTIGHGRKSMGPPKGKKLPGHMGSERTVLKGLKIWRINHENNVIFVQGPAVPGATGAYVYIYDTAVVTKKYADDNVPPFPTYYGSNDETEFPANVYDKDLHPFDDPSLLFEETEEEKRANAAALKAAQKKAKIAKIR